MIEYLIIASAVLIGTTTQRVAGFGAPIIIIPAVLLFYSPPVTLITVLPIGIISSIIVLSNLKQSKVNWAILRRIFVLGTIGVIIGAYVTSIIEKSLLQIVLGSVVILSVNIQEFFLPRTNHKLQPDKSLYGFGFIAGFFNSTVGLSAAPLLIWIRKHNIKPNELRKMLAIIFITANILSILAIVAFASSPIKEINFFLLAGVIPVIFAANKIGHYISERINVKIFEKLAYVVLNLTGIICFTAGILGL